MARDTYKVRVAAWWRRQPTEIHVAVIGFVGVLILAFCGVIGAIAPTLLEKILNPSATPTPTDGAESKLLTQIMDAPTPATPILVALRDLEIRDGPGADFQRMNILPVNSSLDILGISQDRLWYQILLHDGRIGWVLASSTGSRFEGDRGAVIVIVPSPTPSSTLTNTTTPIDSPEAPLAPTATNTATGTSIPTRLDTATATSNMSTKSATRNPMATESSMPITLTQVAVSDRSPALQGHTMATPVTFLGTSYVCGATIVSREPASTQLNIVRSYPSKSSPLRNSIRQGTEIRVVAKLDQGRFEVWYQIAEDEVALGWVLEEYVVLSLECP